jgi:DNA-binding NarL/FixJ family response regulator
MEATSVVFGRGHIKYRPKIRLTGANFYPQHIRVLLELAYRAKSDREVATAVGVTEGTAKTYVGRIYRMSNLSTRLELTIALCRAGGWQHRGDENAEWSNVTFEDLGSNHHNISDCVPILKTSVPLTQREQKMLELSCGPAFNNKRIAKELNISEDTVKYHFNGAYRKFSEHSTVTVTREHLAAALHLHGGYLVWSEGKWLFEELPWLYG